MRPVKPTPEQVRAALDMLATPMYARTVAYCDRRAAGPGAVAIVKSPPPRLAVRWATVTHDPEGQDEAARIVLRLFQGGSR